MISKDDRVLLRELAARVAEIGHDPIQQKRAAMWRRHNDLQRERPMVLIFPEGAWREMLPDTDLKTTTDAARAIERDLRIRLYYWEHMRDDNVIEPVFPSYAAIHDTSWGVNVARTRPEQDTGACHYEPVIKTEADIEKILIPEIRVDSAATEQRFRELQDLLGDLLAIERRAWPYTGMAIMDLFAQWRGLDQVFYDMVDRPAWLHRAMERMCQGMISMHEAILRTGLVTINNRNHYTGSGGTGYTSQLPQRDFDGAHVRSKDLWGFATTQIFSEVSPAMHEEFALQYERRFLSRFGLNAYGCCEPLHNKLDIVRTIPNLRRISISPWADVRKSAEALGNRYIFSWKPNPAMVAGEAWQPDAVRRQIRETLAITRGCVVEMILKDTHTCRSDPRRMWEWVRIAREEAEAAG
jgi:hypothetical protein